MSGSVESQLYDAARDGLVSEVSSLLRDNPEINVNWTNPGFYQFAALHSASRWDDVEVVKLLLAHPNINVNLQSIDGWTPLSFGCWNGQVSVVRVMLKDPRVDVTLDDNSGCTPPLWYAFRWGRHEVIECLIASARDLGDIMNKKGTYSWDGKYYTALEIARENQITDVVSLLGRFLASPALTRQEIRQKLNFTGLSLFQFQFHFISIFIFVNKQKPRLRDYLELRVASLCASTVPETFTDPAEVTFLSLADCGLNTVPEKFGLIFFSFFCFFCSLWCFQRL